MKDFDLETTVAEQKLQGGKMTMKWKMNNIDRHRLRLRGNGTEQKLQGGKITMKWKMNNKNRHRLRGNGHRTEASRGQDDNEVENEQQ